MATLKQKKAIQKLSENIGKPADKSVGKIMLESGYSKSTSETPKRLTDSKAFDVFLKSIDDKEIVAKWRKWATSEKDKRVAMEAGKEIMKLKDRYPKETSKVVGLFGVIDSIKE